MTIDIVTLTANLVTAHVAQNPISRTEVPDFIKDVHNTLAALAGVPAAAAPAVATAQAPMPSDSSPAETMASDVAPTVSIEPEAEKEPAAKVAPVLHDDISDSVYKGLDPWLAKRIPHGTAALLSAKNKIHPSVFPDRLICLEDGKAVKLIRPYVLKHHGLSFQDYLAKWHLPADFPVAPPSYLEQKRAHAKEAGLGVTTRAKREKAVAAPVAVKAKAKATRGRKPAPKADPMPTKAARGQRRAEPIVG